MNFLWRFKMADSYEEWLEQTDQDDTQNARDWYNCPDEDREQWMENHPGYFDIDPETGDTIDP
jgi:hypothetical protein